MVSMRVEAAVGRVALGKIGESRWFSRALLVALLVFLLSFFFLDYSKTRNNIYYGFFAFPVLLFVVPGVWRKKIGPSFVFLLLYFFAAFIAELLSGDPLLGFLKHQAYVVLLFLGLMLCVDEKPYFDLAALVYAAVCVVFACLAFYFLFEAYRAMHVLPRIQLYAAAANPVHASLMIMTGWLGFWVIYGLPKLQSKGRWAYLAGFCVMLGFAFLVCLAFQSRSALLGFLAALGGWLALGRERGLSLLVVAALALLVFCSGAYEALLERGVSYRVEIWLDALKRLQESCSWISGCTQVGRPLYLGQFYHAHSAYISILVDTGLLGAVSFAAFACVYFVLGVRTRSPWFIVSLVGWAGVVASTNGLINSPRPLWIYFWLPTLLALLDFERKPADQALASS